MKIKRKREHSHPLQSCKTDDDDDEGACVPLSSCKRTSSQLLPLLNMLKQVYSHVQAQVHVHKPVPHHSNLSIKVQVQYLKKTIQRILQTRGTLTDLLKSEDALQSVSQLPNSSLSILLSCLYQNEMASSNSMSMSMSMTSIDHFNGGEIMGKGRTRTCRSKSSSLTSAASVLRFVDRMLMHRFGDHYFQRNENKQTDAGAGAGAGVDVIDLVGGGDGDAAAEADDDSDSRADSDERNEARININEIRNINDCEYGGATGYSV